MTPDFIYGTAWKEDATASCVALALAAGFRAIDTANQRKHYDEAGAGEGLARAGVPREALFLQSKFTFADGQDHRLDDLAIGALALTADELRAIERTG